MDSIGLAIIGSTGVIGQVHIDAIKQLSNCRLVGVFARRRRPLREQAAELGIKHIWMQPGAESEKAVKRAEQLGMNIVAGGPCALVTLRYHENEPVRTVEPSD